MQHKLEQSTREDEYRVLPISGGHGLHDPLAGAQLEARRRRRWSPTVWRLTLMLGDSFLLLFSLFLLFLLAPLLHLGLYISWNVPGTWGLKCVWGCGVLVSWSIAVRLTRAQDLAYVSSRLRSLLCVLLALVLMFALWMLLVYPFTTNRFASSVVTAALLLLIAAPVLGVWRVSLAEFMHSPRFRFQGVIIGATIAGEAIAKELRNSKRPGANILGYIGEDADQRLLRDGLPVLGGIRTLHHLTHSGIIDLIIMAIDYRSNLALLQEAIEATQLGISVVPVTLFYEHTSDKVLLEQSGDKWDTALPLESSVSPLYLCWRKMIDITFGLCGLLMLLLLLPILAPLIYLDSRGPIFYSQERLGYRGRKITIYKFRSMHPNAERVGNALWATENDVRVTRIGRIMRVMHLDELPQVFNILRGDMSLIGPRPEREEFVNKLEKSIPFYRCRLMVKPGLSGWAQVKYSYTNTEHGACVKLQYDLYYIKHRSIMLDILILVKTIGEVLSFHGT